MTTLNLTQFGGQIPRRNRRLLPDANGQVAVNCLLTSGTLDPIAAPKQVLALTGASQAKTIYRMYDAAGNDYWLTWPYDVDAVKGSVAGDTSFRLYFASDSFEPRATNLSLATATQPYPALSYVLGVCAPITGPVVTSAGGSGATESRVYIYTYVTPWGEEGAPSPASLLSSGRVDGTWTVSLPNPAPSNSGSAQASTFNNGVVDLYISSNYAIGLRPGDWVTLTTCVPDGRYKVLSVDHMNSHITVASATADLVHAGTWAREAPYNTSGMTKRVYRATSGTYQFVDEVPVSQLSYTDVKVSLGASCATVGWMMPPTDLRGLVSLPCGALAGFSGNSLCFSVPYAPYAWPLSYQMTTDYPIVGLGVFGQTVVVCTAGATYMCSGTAPGLMSMSRLERPWPCVSKRSIVSVGDGVMYATTLGLVLVGVAGANLVTEAHYTVAEWSKLALSAFIAGHYDGRYYSAYGTDPTAGTLMIFGQGNLSFSALPVAGMFSDPANGALYMLSNNVIYKWMGDVGTRSPMDWQSKEFVVPDPLSFGAVKIRADFTQDAASAAAAQANQSIALSNNQMRIAANTTAGSLNARSLNALPLNGSLVVPVPPAAFNQLAFTLYQDGAAVYNTPIGASGMYRLPAVGKGDVFSMRVTGNVPVLSIHIGETPLELKQA